MGRATINFIEHPCLFCCRILHFAPDMQVHENTADPTGLLTVLTQSIAVSASNVAEIIVKRLLCCFNIFFKGLLLSRNRVISD